MTCCFDVQKSASGQFQEMVRQVRTVLHTMQNMSIIYCFLYRDVVLQDYKL